MSREPSPRRRLDPATLSRNPSQERLIAELQGRLGIQPEAEEAAGAAGDSTEDWMTEGVVITVQPRGRRAEGQLVEKVAGRCPGLGQDQGSSILILPQLWPEGSSVWGGPASCGPGEPGRSGKARAAWGRHLAVPLLAELCPSSFSSFSFLPSFSPGGFPSRLSHPPEKNLLCPASSFCPFAPASPGARGQQLFSPTPPACPLPPGAPSSPLWAPWAPECWGRAAGRTCAEAHLSPSCTPHCEVRGLPD